jgi:hypothetical protein
MSSFELKKRENGKTTLGTGSFGAVQLACHTQSDSLYAVKIVTPPIDIQDPRLQYHYPV